MENEYRYRCITNVEVSLWYFLALALHLQLSVDVTAVLLRLFSHRKSGIVLSKIAPHTIHLTVFLQMVYFYQF